LRELIRSDRSALLGAGLIASLLMWTTWGSAPVIQSFTADRVGVSAGQTANLKWSVEHGTDVSIDRGIGPVDASGIIPVSPIQTTTYTLTAKQGGQTVSKTVTLKVVAAAPDFARLHEELRCHRHLTLQLLWEEYRQAHPDGYSRF
jgi:hypothetical protein